eukprot:238841-Ditylum_brightwellii.AAC.1
MELSGTLLLFGQDKCVVPHDFHVIFCDSIKWFALPSVGTCWDLVVLQNGLVNAFHGRVMSLFKIHGANNRCTIRDDVVDGLLLLLADTA